MNLESFAERINSLREIEEYEDRDKIKETKVVQSSFTVQKKRNGFGNFPKKIFSQLNDKGYYFQCGIVFLPFAHRYLREINQFK